jgi:hypothetical protein
MKAVYGSGKDGSDIYKNKKGFFIIQWNPHTKNEYKKYLRGYKPTGPNELEKELAVIRRRTRKAYSKKRRTTKYRH